MAEEILSMDLADDKEVAGLVERYNELTEQLSEFNQLKKERDGIRDELLDILGDANEGVLRDWVLERNEINRKGFEVEEKTFSKLKIRKRGNQ